MLLRNYLDFASRGIEALDAATTECADSENDSEFEAAVESALKSRGLDVRRQIGCSGFRIDLAVVHPNRPGRYVLGIECDGATYHSSATARDRDRLRQEILEDLGWTFCRIWSTDWVRNPERQNQSSTCCLPKRPLRFRMAHLATLHPLTMASLRTRKPKNPFFSKSPIREFVVQRTPTSTLCQRT